MGSWAARENSFMVHYLFHLSRTRVNATPNAQESAMAIKKSRRKNGEKISTLPLRVEVKTSANSSSTRVNTIASATFSVICSIFNFLFALFAPCVSIFISFFALFLSGCVFSSLPFCRSSVESAPPNGKKQRGKKRTGSVMMWSSYARHAANRFICSLCAALPGCRETEKKCKCNHNNNNKESTQRAESEREKHERNTINDNAICSGAARESTSGSLRRFADVTVHPHRQQQPPAARTSRSTAKRTSAREKRNARRRRRTECTRAIKRRRWH